MHDVIGAYQRLEHIYQLYIKSAFPMRYSVLREERAKLLNRSGILSQPPLIEPIPVYPSSGKTLTQAAQSLPSDYLDLKALGQTLFSPDIELYRHQWQSLTAVCEEHKDIVVTTGTGSGKTECFLLPLLAELAKESRSWVDCPPLPKNYRWWDETVNQKKHYVEQWKHAKRPAAVRALILYPLNALVEDQLRRLRQSLDAQEVHDWLDQNRGRNRITFGRYTSLTLVPGQQKDSSIKRLLTELKKQDEQWHSLQNASNLEDNPELRYYFPRLDGGEMRSRWDMQATPPDILITNYSMLNIMMMRAIENNIFDQTCEWLASDPENQFFLVVDELHSYRGTPGTEVAYLLRLLYHRLGLTPNSPQLRILTTTASLDDSEAGRKFLREFFGRDNFEFIREEQVSPVETARYWLQPYQEAFSKFAQTVDPNPIKKEMLTQAEVPDEAMQELARALGCIDDTLTPERQLGTALAQLETGGAKEALRDACQNVNGGEVRATCITQLDEQLFPNLKTSKSLVSDALRGFLMALGVAKLENGRSPQPVRGHLFFHNLENMWACSNPDCTDPNCNLSERQQNDSNPTIGALHDQHRLTCDCGSRVLDLLVCDSCGDIFLGGYSKTIDSNDPKKGQILTPDQPNLEGIPDQVDFRKYYGSYRIFWPIPKGKKPWTEAEPMSLEWQLNGIKRRWRTATLNFITGTVEPINGTKAKMGKIGEHEVPGWLYDIPDQVQNSKPLPALPSKCPRCDSDYSYRQIPHPMRSHRTGFSKASQVLAGALLREMPLPENVDKSSSRKLVIFSDSRQDAAKLAAGMERDHYQDMVRSILFQNFQDVNQDLVSFLRVICDGNEEQLKKLKDYPLLYQKVIQPGQNDDLERSDRFEETDPRMAFAGSQWLQGKRISNPDQLEQWLLYLKNYPSKVGLSKLRNKVKDELLRYGICPGGALPKSLFFYIDKKSQNWFSCYNWHKLAPKLAPNAIPTEVPNPNNQVSKHLQKMDDQLFAELMYGLFPHRARTVESIGLGWVSLDWLGQPTQVEKEVIDAIIRELGIRRLYRYSEYLQAGSEDKLPTYIKNYLKHINKSNPTLMLNEDRIRNYLLSGAEASANSLVLNPDQLYLVSANGNQGYRCEKCNAFYLHPAAGYCPLCNSRKNAPSQPLNPATTTSDLEYYDYLITKAGPPFRMNAAELTGQTDRGDRPNRQRWFQDVFIPGEISRVQGIDLLSVTTTMEAGVDIGALLAVMMSNMPPRRFNYQQRVGRAGRRSTGVSLAVTFCRGRSHDDYYFQRLDEMTGDPPPSPYVDLRRPEILQRVLIKEVLRLAFPTARLAAQAEGNGVKDAGSDQVHGEFGDCSEWSSYREFIQDWLQEPENRDEIATVFNNLKVQTHFELKDQQAIVSFVYENLLDDVDKIANDHDNYTQRKLSERLANAGLLPMFGFPTRTRNLYTKWPSSNGEQWPPERGVIDRNLDIALGQFAPGSQTVKDKQVHTACGVVNLYRRGRQLTSDAGFIPPLPNSGQAVGLCRNCQAVSFPHATIEPPRGGRNLEVTDCPVCGEKELRQIDAREPAGFFTDLQPKDYTGQFEWQPRATRATLSFDADYLNQQGTVINNAKILTANDQIISVNDNGGNGGFDFDQSVKVFGNLQVGAYAIKTQNDVLNTSGQSYRIALLSKRKTDILLVSINQWPMGIFADPTKVEGRAAWYSLAFWLKIAAAAYLDVDSQELQAGFRVIKAQDSGRVVGQAFLCDSLDNGAGYCSFLAQPREFQKLLEQGNIQKKNSLAQRWLDHGQSCDTSCNGCLRDYANQAYHGLLDWRLALEMVRLIRDKNTVIDLETNWLSEENPWLRLINAEASPAAQLLTSLKYEGRKRYDTLWGFTHCRRYNEAILVRHPLWTDEHLQWLTACEALHQEKGDRYASDNIKAVTPFNLLRRPGEYA